jgi:hypothetical protein
MKQNGSEKSKEVFLKFVWVLSGSEQKDVPIFKAARLLYCYLKL